MNEIIYKVLKVIFKVFEKKLRIANLWICYIVYTYTNSIGIVIHKNRSIDILLFRAGIHSA